MADEALVRVGERQDLAGLFSRLKRHLPIILASMALFTVLAFVGTQFLPKRYTATAQLDYSPQEAVAGAQNLPLSDQARDAQIDGQIQVVKSLPVALRVVDLLKLERDPELVTQAAEFKGEDSTAKQAIAAAVLRNLTAERVGTTTLFDVAYTDKNPLKAMNIANAFTKSYLETQLDSKLQQVDQSSDRLTQRLEQLRREVEIADAAVASFRVRNNLLSQPDSAALESEISTIRAGLAQARAEAAGAAVRRSAAARDTVVGGGSGGPIDTAALGALRTQRAEVARRLASLQGRYGERHPLIVDAQKEVAAIDDQIAQEMRGLSRTAGAESSVAGSRAASLEASLNGAQARLASSVAASVKLADLTRQAQNARDQYQQLLTTSGQQNAERALARPDTRLSAPATLPLSPSSPNLPVNLFLGMVLGLAVGLGIAYVREQWTRGLGTVDDIEILLGQNYLNSVPTPASSIPTLKTKDPAEAVVLHPLSAYTEAFRNLATSLTYAAAPKTGKVIGITSSLPREGKTTTSLSIARVLAAGGSKVALVDADLRRRSITMATVPQAAAGLIEVLRGDATLAQVTHTDPSGAEIIPLSEGSHAATRLFGGDEFETLIAKLRTMYDVIVFDTAPILAVTDTRVLLRHFDAMALLARWRATPVKAVRAALHQIETVGGKVTGVALTMVNIKMQAESGYGDPSYYTDYTKDYYVAA